MINNIYRIGNFTSSEIVALTTVSTDKKSFGKPALTYIEETNMERRLGRSLTGEVGAKPLTWGHLLEQRVFESMGLEYILLSHETVLHPTIPFWAGSPDGVKHDPGKTVADIKCPSTLKSFCQLVDPLYDGFEGIDAMNCIRGNHKDGEKFYWQLVSNSILLDTQFAELIIYMPYKSELEEIRVMAQMVDSEHLHKHYWIAMAGENDLPYLPDCGYYRNLNMVRFEVPQADKYLLTEKVLTAGKMLIEFPQPVAA
jgi:hypothetical protein